MINSANHKKIKIPSNFDSEELLNFHPSPNEIICPYKLNYIVYLLTIKMKTEGVFKGFTFLNAQTLRNIIRNYKEHLAYLKDVGVMAKVKPYKVGFSSKGYKLGEEYLGGLKDVYVPKSIFVKTKSFSSLKKRVKTSKTKKCSNPKDKIFAVQKNTRSVVNNKKYEYLNRWFNPKLTIDMNEVDNWLDKNLDSTKKYYHQRRLQIKSKAILINNCNYDGLKVDGFGQRYYSSVSNLKSELKKFLRYDNELLQGIDIKSSLPYMLGLLMSSKDKRIIGIGEQVLGKYKKRRRKERERELPNMLHNLIQSLDTIEVERYLKLVSNGGIYEYFAKLLIAIQPYYLTEEKMYVEEEGVSTKLSRILNFKSYDDIDKYNRKAAKFLILRILSSKFEDKLFFKVFKSEFPTISNFLESLKSIGGATDRHKCSSQVLQRIESYIVLELIAKEFVSRYNQLILTIHDNLITTIHYKDKLKILALEIFDSLCPIPPKFHHELLCQNCLKVA